MEKITTIEQLTERLPEEFQPVAVLYGPVLLKMAHDELWDWIELMAGGDTENAYRTLLGRMPGGDLLKELDKLSEEWGEANETNSQRINIQRDASLAVLRVGLQMAMILVGL